MTSEHPAWEPFDPSSDGLPKSLHALLSDSADRGRVVVTAVAPATEDEDWPALAAVRVAEASGAHLGRTLLIDLGLEHPTLHRALDLAPDEGISDVFQFSASFQRVAKAVREGSFLFTPAGTVVAEPGAILGSQAWDGLLRRYVDEGTTVVLHVPLSAEGAEIIVSKADAVVWMAGPADSPGTAFAAYSGPVAWVGPPPETPVATPTAPDSPQRVALASGAIEDAASLEVLLSEELAGHEPVPTPEEASLSAVPDDAADDPDPFDPDPFDPDPFWEGGSAAPGATTWEPDGDAYRPDVDAPDPALEDLSTVAHVVPEARPGLRVLLGMTLVLIVVAAVLMVMFDRDPAPPTSAAESAESVTVSADRAADPEGDALGDDPPGESANQDGTPPAAGSDASGDEITAERAPAESSADAPTSGSPVTSAGGPLSFGLTVNAHEGLAAARRQATAIESRFSSVHAPIVPVRVGGTTWYRVLVGPAASVEEAEQLRSTLSGFLGASVARGAIVRSTRLAYLLGEYPDRAGADARAREAEGAGIPAYLAEVPSEGGTSAYRVYSGAFSNREESAALGALLDEAGLSPAPLTERIGRPTR